MEKNRGNSVQRMCITAVMAAVYVVLDIFTEGISAPFAGNLKLSFSGLPVILVAVLAGPVWGGLCGGIGELLSQMICYGLEPATLIYVLAPAVRGLTMGWLYRALGCRRSLWALGLEIGLSSVLVTLVNTGGMLVQFWLNGTLMAAYVAVLVKLPGRLVSGLVTGVLFTLLLPVLLKTVEKAVKIKITPARQG